MDKTEWFKKVLIFGAIIGVALLIYTAAGTANATTVCDIVNGCTGPSTPPGYGQLLIGGKSGEYEYIASSTLEAGSGFSTTSAAYWLTQQTTSGLAEGSNLYFTNARADSRFVTDLAATTSVKSITTLPS